MKNLNKPIFKIKFIISGKDKKGEQVFLLTKDEDKKNQFSIHPSIEIFNEIDLLKIVRNSAVNFIGGRDLLGVPMIINDVVECDKDDKEEIKIYYYIFEVSGVVESIKDCEWLSRKRVISKLDNIKEREAIRSWSLMNQIFLSKTKGEEKLKKFLNQITKSERYLNFIEKYKNKSLDREFFLKLAQDFGIDKVTFSELGEIKKGNVVIDMIKIEDRVDKLKIDKIFSKKTKENDELNVYEESEIFAYPVVLKIHLNSTFNDLRSFFSKNWLNIEKILEKRRKTKVPVIKGQSTINNIKKDIEQFNKHRESVLKGELFQLETGNNFKKRKKKMSDLKDYSNKLIVKHRDEKRKKGYWGS